MGWLNKTLRALSGAVGIILLVFAFLFRETLKALVTAPITAWVTSVQTALGGEWIFRSAVALAGVFLILVAIGLEKVVAPAKRFYDWYRNLRQPEKVQELETQERWRGQDALDKYLDQMLQWIDDENRPLATLSYDDPRRKMARTQTLAILNRLDPNGKREVVRFLHEHGLIRGKPSVVPLYGADLSDANLTEMDLRGTNFDGANLSGADMSRSMFCGFVGHSAGFSKVAQRGGEWQDLMRPMTVSELSGANLSGAVLRRTVFTGCNLLGADFGGADLDSTDVRGGADLRLARNLTQEQIESAYGSVGEQEYMPDTMLPEDLEASKAWEKLLSQQIREREQSQGGGES